MSLLALALVFLIGALIGAVGVGGFLLVPVLVFLDGRPVRDAVILATVSFVGAGLAALYMETRQRGWSGAASRTFVLASAPGALIGALLLRVIAGPAISLAIAIAVGLAGLAELLGVPKKTAYDPRPWRAALNGLLTGTASALTGTSGPLIGMPLLALSGIPIIERIRTSQLAQLPIALTATAVFLTAGDIFWRYAVASAATLAAGALFGMRITPAVRPSTLSKTAGILMLLTACSMLLWLQTWWSRSD